MYTAFSLHKLGVSYEEISQTTPFVINGKRYKGDFSSFLSMAGIYADTIKDGIRQFKIKTDGEINSMITDIKQLWNDTQNGVTHRVANIIHVRF